MCIVVFSVARVALAEPLGYKVLDGLPEQFRLCVAKQFRCAWVRATNDPCGIRDKYRVGRNIKQILQRGVSELGPIRAGPQPLRPLPGNQKVAWQWS